MAHKQHTRNASGPAGPSQRQLRAGELIRHALVDILREEDIHDPALVGVSVTVTEVRLSPDLKHATCFVEPLAPASRPRRRLDTRARSSRRSTPTPNSCAASWVVGWT